MAQAESLSLTKFTETVQAAVKAAVQKHPKFQIQPPQQVAISYLIRGIPVPESIATRSTMAEVQGFANDVAASIARAAPIALARETPEGVVYSRPGHVIIGIVASPDVLLEK